MSRPRGRPRAAHIKLEGYDRVWAKAKNIEEALPLLLGASLHSEAKRIMALSKSSYVPVATGRLLASGYVKKPVYAGPIVDVELGFGGTKDSEHATFVHEWPRSGETGGVTPPWSRKQNYPLGTYAKTGQWKYLEEPANVLTPTSAKRIGAEMMLNLAALAKRI